MAVTAPTTYYKADEASGDLVDYMGVANLTAHGSPGTTTGKINDARTIASASSQYFSSTNATFSPGTSTHFSGCAWVKFTSSVTATQIVFGKDEAGGREYIVWISNLVSKRFEFWDPTNTALGDTVFGDLSTNTWYLVAFGWDGTNKWLSVNAGTRDTAAVGSWVAGTSTELDIGRRSYSGFPTTMDGAVDGIGWWSGHDLSDAELAEIYNSGSGSESWLPAFARGFISPFAFVYGRAGVVAAVAQAGTRTSMLSLMGVG